MALASKQVKFEAAVGRGSDVIFSIEFGDGAAKRKPGSLHPLLLAEVASFAHTYPAAGCYNITIKASNVLGDRSTHMLLTVQEPPSGLHLDFERRHAPVGEPVKLRVSLDSGTDVKFEWELGNGSRILGGGKCCIFLYIYV